MPLTKYIQKPRPPSSPKKIPTIPNPDPAPQRPYIHRPALQGHGLDVHPSCCCAAEIHSSSSSASSSRRCSTINWKSALGWVPKPSNKHPRTLGPLNRGSCPAIERFGGFRSSAPWEISRKLPLSLFLLPFRRCKRRSASATEARTRSRSKRAVGWGGKTARKVADHVSGMA